MSGLAGSTTSPITRMKRMGETGLPCLTPLPHLVILVPRCNLTFPYWCSRYHSNGGGIPAAPAAAKIASWETVLNAFARSKNSTASGFISLCDFLRIAWRRADASRHPSLWRKAFCIGEKMNSSLILLATILWRSWG